MTKNVQRVFILNELNIILAIFYALTGISIIIVGVIPFLPRNEKYLSRLKIRLKGRASVKSLEEEFPMLGGPWEHPRPMLNNLYAEVEDKIRAIYFDGVLNKISEDTRVPFKQCVAAFYGKNLHIIQAVSDICDKYEGGRIRIYGAQRNFRDVTIHYNNDVKSRAVFSDGPFTCVFNFFLFLLFATAIVIKTIASLSFGRIKRENVFLAADFIGDPDDAKIYETASEFGTVALLPRNGEININNVQKLPSNVSVMQKKGRIFWLDAGKIITENINTVFSLYRIGASWDAGVAYFVLGIPFKRVAIKAVFSVVLPEIFWCRDLYNVNHIIRSQELRLVNRQSWGVLHAYVSYCDIYPMFQYIDVDELFVLGKAIKERGYEKTWPARMGVHQAKSFRHNSSAPINKRNERQILFLCSVYSGEENLYSIISSVAGNFPDTRVIIQIKKIFQNSKPVKEMVDRLMSTHENIIYSTESPYDLMPRAHLCFSDPSAIALEAAQFGLPTFMIDIPEVQKVSIYREIENFCIRTPHEAIERVRQSIENGLGLPKPDLENYISLNAEPFSTNLKRHLLQYKKT